MHIQFLGATDTVTGSRFLLDTGEARVLIDCGLFQGYKALRLRNWDRFPISPDSLDAVVLTHAHIDHSGYLPLLVKRGYKGRVHCTTGTSELCGLLLPDSAHLAEEDANYANRKGYSRHQPALPLYTVADAMHALEYLKPAPYSKRVTIARGVEAEFHRAGHILGSSSVTIHAKGRRILFSGDLGPQDDMLMRPPEPPTAADYLIVESTYGDRLHPEGDPIELLADIIRKTVARGGSVIIPVFAVGRAQLLLYCLYRLRQRRRFPDVPIYLNSPMAIEATRILSEHTDELRLDPETCAAACSVAIPTRSMEESIRINRLDQPKIILAGSGMLTGGRVVHHLESFGQDPRSTFLLVGFQAAGTRGAALASGQRTLRMHGREVELRASVEQIRHFSAHADADGLMDWMSAIGTPPRQTFIVHGEPGAADALRQRIEHSLHWDVTMPEYRGIYRLD
ncbi:metallo-beta-lactamase family protein [Cupriavidus metallidurans]|jgi:metallo-beta-lactamase family protein|uniref:MBL fold metallo-hydrolase RNA specificity domain-containing protein n=1 Tax=Cupriavidus TaxID=106589 RepID=UPI0004939897|nr:MBL fold metallo-hydrolase [Cupriavidus metallidurans]KWW38455.1 Ribonuclease [Cupriavidus metallidurans]MDE4920330.1 MBL fold metallo-hydrolase [Cupriavidus metallidurans]